MKSLVKKLVIYSMVGLFSAGLGTGVIEASPRDNHDQRYEHRNEQRDHDREKQRHEEMQRHEREMQRREHERYEDWQERQRIENARHEQAMQDLGIAALIYIIANANQ